METWNWTPQPKNKKAQELKVIAKFEKYILLLNMLNVCQQL